MKKALPVVCLLGALLVAGTGHAKEDESAAAEMRITHLLRGMAHRSDAIVAEAKARYVKAADAHKRKPLEAMLALPLKKALRSFCVNELGRLADKRSLPVLAKCSVRDKDKDVRAAAVEALRALKSARTTHVLSQALRSRRTSDRVRATQAMGALGDVNAAPYILCRWVARSGDFPRGHFAQTTQHSYLADFEVEVAKTSFIADPEIGLAVDGAAQPVRVLATVTTFTTVERKAYANALAKLTGVDHGTRLRKWLAWWKKNGARLLGDGVTTR